jgi:hypothetical protein
VGQLPKYYFSWAEGTHLSQPWFPSCVVVHVDQVRFSPERTQARPFERGPPVMEEIKFAIVVPGMQLELQLPDRERRARERTRWLVRVQECGQRVKFGTLDVDLQHVDESVAWIRVR